MNLDLDKLGCEHSDLLDFHYILKRVKPTHIYMLAMRGDLVLSTTSVDGGNSIDQVTITVPYSGKRCEGFIPTKEFSNSLRSDQGVLVFTTTEKPKGWHTKLPSRPRELVDLSAKDVHRTLEYLLRITHNKDDDWNAGLIFSKGEIVATDKTRMHIDNSLPNMIDFDQEDEIRVNGEYWVETVPGRALMGLGAAQALMRATRLMPNARLLGGHQHADAHTRGFVFELQYGKTKMAITSRPWIQTRDTRNGRPSGDENNASFTVYTDHLETLLKYALKQRDAKKRSFNSTVVLEYTESQTPLKARIKTNYMNEYDVAQFKEEGTHELICMSSRETGRTYWVELDAHFLLDAIQGIGESTQFILPTHPVDGLETCHINPVYVTGKPGRFAVVSPCCDSDTWGEAIETRRKRDPREDNNYCRPSV